MNLGDKRLSTTGYTSEYEVNINQRNSGYILLQQYNTIFAMVDDQTIIIFIGVKDKKAFASVHVFSLRVNVFIIMYL